MIATSHLPRLFRPCTSLERDVIRHGNACGRSDAILRHITRYLLWTFGPGEPKPNKAIFAEACIVTSKGKRVAKECYIKVTSGGKEGGELRPRLVDHRTRYSPYGQGR